MTFAILIEDYNLFYSNTIANSHECSSKKYSEILTYLLRKKYYQSDSLALGLQTIGHKAHVILPDCNPLQLQYTKENFKKLYLKWNLEAPIRSYRTRILKNHHTFDTIRQEILTEQLKKIKPDILFVYSGIWMEKKFIQKLKKQGIKVILQWSCPITGRWQKLAFEEFDFIVSASMPLVNYFHDKNLKAYYLQQAFDKSILTSAIEAPISLEDIIFIGNFTLGHDYRFEVLEYLLQNGVNLDIYGGGKEKLPENSLVRKNIKSPLQGLEMNAIYKKYKLALHIHGEGVKNDGIDWSSFAGAKRIFEITGIGTTLLTSYQENLKKLFEPDEEILTFKSKEECLQKINYYLAHNEERKKIALAGQKRTLKDHSFSNRAEQLCEYLKMHFKKADN